MAERRWYCVALAMLFAACGGKQTGDSHTDDAASHNGTGGVEDASGGTTGDDGDDTGGEPVAGGTAQARGGSGIGGAATAGTTGSQSSAGGTAGVAGQVETPGGTSNGSGGASGGGASSGGIEAGDGGAGVTDPAPACTDAGGTIETIRCCDTVGDFPNRCRAVDCTCSDLHEVLSCSCPDGQCFDGTTCVHDCGPYLDCNWCGGQSVVDDDGCTVSYTCQNGRDACAAERCENDQDCDTAGDECTDWGVCWAPDTTVTGEFTWVANPCTTDPCLPGLVAAIASENQTYRLLIDGRWVWGSYDWRDWPGVIPEVGDAVLARGDLIAGELVLTSLELVL